MMKYAWGLSLTLGLAACGGGSGVSGSPMLPPAAPTTQGIAFIGDSITAGSRLPDNPNGISDPHSLSPTAYPFLVGKALNEQVQDLGIGGEMIGPAITDELPRVNPLSRVVVVYLGTNNVTFGNPNQPIVANAETQLTSLLGAVKAKAPRACVVLVTLPHDPYAPSMDPYQDQFDAFEIGLGYPTLDLRTQAWTSDPSNYIPDGVHPNPIGNSDLAVSVQTEIQAACK